jgi:serine/threonine-protein kinase RsbW
MSETSIAGKHVRLGAALTGLNQFGTLAATDQIVMADDPIISMTMASAEENVLLVREALVGMSHALGLDALALEDILTAVTEACNNVVLHAYPRGTGPLQFEVRGENNVIQAVVRDHGVGVRPKLRSSRAQIAGIGIPVIQSLAQRVEFRRPSSDGGTEVRMEFETRPAGTLDGLAGEVSSVPLPFQHDPASIAITVAPPWLLQTLLPRLLGVLGAQADFSTNRLSDVHILADALAAHAPEALEVDGLALIASVTPRSLELSVGPLSPAGGERLLGATEIPSLGWVIERLTDGHSMSPGDGPGMLVLELRDRT